MVIKITTKSTIIPVQIDDLEFKVTVTDENLKRIRDSATELQKKLVNTTDEDFDTIRDAILKIFDLVLGNEAGQQIYNKVGSTTICINILNQLREGLEKEFAERGLSLTQLDRAQQYLKTKKKRNKYR